LQGELLDADLSKYKFKGVDLTAYNLDNVVVPAAVLKKAGLYDDSFYKENILACMEDSRAKTLNCNQVAKAKSEVSIQVDFTSREENARFFYISDIHLEEKIQKKFPKHATETDINYYYDNLEQYAVQVCNKMAKPILALEHIAKAVKSFGGTGFIHGCIVDIDYLNHIYLNPYDGKVTPYYAESIDSKYAYGALPKLLSERCPKLYENYMKLLKEETTAITIFNSTGLEESNEVYYVEETDIYRPSRTIRKLQYITENNIIRLWDDNFLKSILQEDILFLE